MLSMNVSDELAAMDRAQLGSNMTHNSRHMINKESELGNMTDVSSHMPNEVSTGYKSHSNLGSRNRKRKIPL